MSAQSFRARYGPVALIAGASSGLGAEFARQLAARGFNLLLLARRQSLLEELRSALVAQYSVVVDIAAVDLASHDLLNELRAAVGDREVGLLVYNAALSLIGPFMNQSLADKLRVIDVNCRGPLILVDELGRKMVERRRGGLLLMSSLAGSRGSPLVSTYAATKAFNTILAEGLWQELAQEGVDVLACRAGATRTPAYEATKPVGNMPAMESAAVVSAALAALGKKPSMVPGWLNRLGELFMSRVLSRRAAIKIMARATRSMYPDA